jgi:peptide/nickel transport system permease protein
VLIGLRESATGTTDEALVDGPAPLTFAVREGWTAVTLDVEGVTASRVRLEKGNRGLFDSQFVHYLTSLARGDLGQSIEYRLPVAQVLREGVGPSLALTIPILIGGTVIAVMLALLCAAWRGSVTDRAVLILSTVLMSVNYVVWVLAGQFLLAFKMRLFPIWGFESAAYLVLPVLIGIVSGLGRDVRFYRAAILDEIFKPYVRTAQAKGLSGHRIMFRHVLRNSLIPIVTYVSLSVPFLFTGSLMLESFFGIPGLGSVSLNAIHSSDMAVVRAVVILGALLYQIVNMATDVCYAWLDPRVRLA